ncbi:response regulator [Singulisphaera sp. PoT]|uniref:ATP-binding response regulator n=1 Tax=Singulisphaera sp. PoT TaxID=3411797 RepID=UPI003BF50166
MSRILVVEDSPTQALEMEALLEDAGYSVSVVDNGSDALSSVRYSPPDLVVTDLELPGMDGLTLIETFKKDYPFIPVVLVTAHGSEDLVVRALRAGAASYVPKRLLTRDLIPTLKDVLDIAVGRVRRQQIARSMTRVESRFVLDNDSSLITPLVRHIEEDLAAMKFSDPTTLTRVGVALREALVNAIEHGNLELDSEMRQGGGRAYRDLANQRRQESPYNERAVHFTSIVSPTEAIFIIKDDGPGFDPTSLVDPTETSQLLRESGRGIFLIKAFMDEVSFNAAGNEITMKKKASSRPS